MFVLLLSHYIYVNLYTYISACLGKSLADFTIIFEQRMILLFYGRFGCFKWNPVAS